MSYSFNMTDISLSGLKDEFAIHYGGNLHSVEANTFANSIVALVRISISTTTALSAFFVSADIGFIHFHLA